MSRREPKPAGAACLSCPARDAKCVSPEFAITGPPRVRLAIIGEAPGKNELTERRPFVGRSGKMLLRGLKTLGLTRGDVHWTNAVLCECPQEHQAAAAKCCRERLRAELAEVNPIVAMPVGAWALGSTLGLSKKPQISKWRGSITPHKFFDPAPAGNSLGTNGPGDGVSARTPAESEEAATASRTGGTSTGVQFPGRAGGAATSFVMPTFHPAFLMHDGGANAKWGPVVEKDVERVGRVIAHGWVDPFLAPGHQFRVAKNEWGLASLLEQLAPGDIASDCETVGLGPTETDLVCFGMSDGRLTIVVPWSRDKAGRELWWPDPRRIARLVAEAFARRVVVTHNGPAFDHIVYHRYGPLDATTILEPQWEDTLNAYHALHSHMPNNLAHVATQYLDLPPWKQWESRHASLEELWMYCGRDNLYTILTWQALRAEMRDAA